MTKHKFFQSMFLCIFVLIFFTMASATIINAETSYNYYKDLFISWGLHVDTLSENYIVDQTTDGNNIYLAYKKDDEKKVLLLLESNLTSRGIRDVESVNYYNVVIICDEKNSITIKKEIDCDPSLKKPIVINENSIKYIFIPQSLLLKEKSQNIIKEYLRKITKLDEDHNPIKRPKLLNAIDAIRKERLFGVFITILVAFFFSVLFNKSIDKNSGNIRNFFKLNTVQIYTFKISKLLPDTKIFIYLFFINLLVGYFIILSTIYIKGILINNDQYFYKYIFDSFSLSGLIRNIETKNIIRIFFFYYQTLLLILLSLMLIPYVFRVIIESFNNLKLLNIKPYIDVVKYVIFFIVICIEIIISTKISASNIEILTFALFIYFCITIYITLSKINFCKIISKIEQAIFFAIVFAIFLIGHIIDTHQNSLGREYTYERLMGRKDELITLPYTKDWSDSALFSQFSYFGSSSIYADGYLIHKYGAKKIINLPISEFDDTNKEFTINYQDPYKLGTWIINIPNLENYLTRNEYSSFFILNMNEITLADYRPEIIAEISFNCSFKIGSRSIKLRNIFPENNTYDLIEFPGCKNNGKDVETFVSTIKLNDISYGRSAALIEGIEPKFIKKLSLSYNNVPIRMKFINTDIDYEANFKIIYNSNQESTQIINYSTEILDEITIENEPTENDISKPINKLIKLKKLKNPFIIWSSNSGEAIMPL